MVKLSSADDGEEISWPDQRGEVEVETGDDITRAEVDYTHRRGDHDRV